MLVNKHSVALLASGLIEVLQARCCDLQSCIQAGCVYILSMALLYNAAGGLKMMMATKFESRMATLILLAGEHFEKLVAKRHPNNRSHHHHHRISSS